MRRAFGTGIEKATIIQIKQHAQNFSIRYIVVLRYSNMLPEDDLLGPKRVVQYVICNCSFYGNGRNPVVINRNSNLLTQKLTYSMEQSLF